MKVLTPFVGTLELFEPSRGLLLKVRDVTMLLYHVSKSFVIEIEHLENFQGTIIPTELGLEFHVERAAIFKQPGGSW